MVAKRSIFKKHDIRGFTLIEVVLVLAIGGLIFLLAFLAFQQVSSSRRDTQRRADARRFQAEVQSYITNQGISATPPLTTAQFNAFKDDYLTNFTDPGTNQPYTITLNTTALTSSNSMMLRYTAEGRICGTEGGSTGSGATPANYAILFYLERGGRQCIDNK